MRDESECTARHHEAGMAPHEDGDLGVEIPEHGVGIPPADKSDAIGVDFGAKEGHGTRRAERLGADVLGVKAECIRETGTGLTKQPRDTGRGDEVPVIVLHQRAKIPRFQVIFLFFTG